MTSLLTPTPARSIDPRGQRFGAGLSAIVLAVAFLLNLPWLAVLVGVNLGISSFFGTRFFLPGRPWKAVKRTLKLGPTEPEHEYPPRFAQALGFTFLALAGVAFLVGAAPLGWLLVAAVAALQTLLAVTGICVGCRCTSSAGTSRRCSPGCSGGPTGSRRSRCRRSSASPSGASSRSAPLGWNAPRSKRSAATSCGTAPFQRVDCRSTRIAGRSNRRLSAPVGTLGGPGRHAAARPAQHALDARSRVATRTRAGFGSASAGSRTHERPGPSASPIRGMTAAGARP